MTQYIIQRLRLSEEDLWQMQDIDLPDNAIALGLHDIEETIYQGDIKGTRIQTYLFYLIPKVYRVKYND